MELLKVYNVDDMINHDLDLSEYKSQSYQSVYLVMTNDYVKVYRVLKGYDKDYMEVDGIYLVEKERIPKEDVAMIIKKGRSRTYSRGRYVEHIIKNATTWELLKAALLVDSILGFGNWKTEEYNTLEEALEDINKVSDLD